jgi:hypothetical protein
MRRGLPLALIVLGSDLFGKDLFEWKSALDRYKKLPSKNIRAILKVSYDGLKDIDKKFSLTLRARSKDKM